MEQKECSETSAYKSQTPGNYPEESTQSSQVVYLNLIRKINCLKRHLLIHFQPLLHNNYTTGARRLSMKCLRNALCVAITDSLFLKNVSTTKPRCSPDQPMAFSENGKITANQRDPSHHCTPSTARAVTPPNVGVISAAPCIIHFPFSSQVKNTFNIFHS